MLGKVTTEKLWRAPDPRIPSGIPGNVKAPVPNGRPEDFHRDYVRLANFQVGRGSASKPSKKDIGEILALLQSSEPPAIRLAFQELEGRVPTLSLADRKRTIAALWGLLEWQATLGDENFTVRIVNLQMNLLVALPQEDRERELELFHRQRVQPLHTVWNSPDAERIIDSLLVYSYFLPFMSSAELQEGVRGLAKLLDHPNAGVRLYAINIYRVCLEPESPLPRSAGLEILENFRRYLTEATGAVAIAGLAVYGMALAWTGSREEAAYAAPHLRRKFNDPDENSAWVAIAVCDEGLVSLLEQPQIDGIAGDFRAVIRRAPDDVNAATAMFNYMRISTLVSDVEAQEAFEEIFPYTFHLTHETNALIILVNLSSHENLTWTPVEIDRYLGQLAPFRETKDLISWVVADLLIENLERKKPHLK